MSKLIENGSPGLNQPEQPLSQRKLPDIYGNRSREFRQDGNLPKAVQKALLAFSAGALAITLACAPATDTKANFTPTVTPEPSPTATSTPESTPTATSTPEINRQPLCTFLSPDACGLLRPSFRLNPDGSKTLLGFIGILPIGTKVYGDMSGIFAKTVDTNGDPIGILSNEEGSMRKTTTFRGKIAFTGRKTVDGRYINDEITQPGVQQIATIVALSEDPSYSNFTVAINKTERSTGNTVPDMERVKRYLPDFEKNENPNIITSAKQPTQGVIVTDRFK